MMYIWQHGEWPKMTWQEASFSTLLSEVNLLRGQLLGIVSMFGFKEKNEVLLHALTQEIVHSAKIEGQELSRDSVRSSVARQLGLEYIGLPASDHYTEGVVQVMFDATSRYDDIFDEDNNKIQPKIGKEEGTGIGLANLAERYRIKWNENVEVFNDGKNFSVTLPLKQNDQTL